jgi:hypothetical protein
MMRKLLKRFSNTWACGMSNTSHLRAPMARQQNPSSSMMSPHRPAQMIRLRSCCLGTVDPPSISSEPQVRPSDLLLRRDTSAFALVTSALEIRFRSSCFGATSYLMDADRSTMRLSTGYPIDLSRRSSTCWVVAESEA